MSSRAEFEQQILEFLERYRDVICATVDANESWQLKRPESGTTSIVYFAFRGTAAEGKPLCCVRLFPKRSAWLCYRRSLDRLAGFGLPAPRMLAEQSGWMTWLRRGPWILAESFLDGMTMDRVSMDEATAAILGTSIGRLHRNTAPFFEWGSKRYAPEKYRERCLAMTRRRIEQIASDVGKVSSADDSSSGADVERQLHQIGRWLSDRMERWSTPDQFSFIHTELDGDDMIMLDESREVACIDIEKMRFNHRGLDLVMIERWLRRQEGEERAEMLMEKFFVTYWQLVGDGAKVAWREEAPIFKMIWLLSRWASRVKAARRSNGDTERREIENLRREISQLMAEA